MSGLYKEAGVNIEAGEDFIRRIKRFCKSTFSEEVVGNFGGFASLFRLDNRKYDEPLLVSSTDGVGTKLKIATLCNRFDTVGVDLVAMCVNDILTCGAKPLFFLDYLATGKLIVDQAEELIKGIAEGCRQAGCSLIGGETAEMPGVYPEGEFDMAGFAVGIVERKKVIDGSEIRPGDLIFGFSSSGFHSNGYSLLRKILFDEKSFKIDDWIEKIGCTIGEALLRQTKIYVKSVDSIRHLNIKGMAHITGGGWNGNIPRVLPDGCRAVIEKGRWRIPPVFDFIKSEGEISEEEMYSCFNMGIGFVLFIGKDDEGKVKWQEGTVPVEQKGDSPFFYRIGEVKEGKKGLEII